MATSFMATKWNADVVTADERMGRLVRRTELLQRVFWAFVGVVGFFAALAMVQG